MATFEWSEYLEQNKTVAVAEELFDHVEASLSNGIKQGMLLEVCHSSNPDTYWIAEITMVCSHLLRIKFIGAETDFWCDISETKVHPLGWCGKYDEQIEPPEEINQKYGDKIIDIMRTALFDGQSVSLDALKNKGMAPIDRIKAGMKVEVQNLMDPYKYWVASVCDNVGGRLQLKYDGSDEDLPKFWIFFNNQRLSYFGFVTNKGSPWQFKYPGKVNKYACKNKLSAHLRQCAEEAINDPAPADLFQPDQSHLEVHNFVPGMKLEALDPVDRQTIRPATVTKVFNNYHFLVTIDGHAQTYEESRLAWLCDSHHPYIFPIGFAAKHRIPLTPPPSAASPHFEWDEYLTKTSSVPAPEYCFKKKEPVKGFEVNMKLEAVNPLKCSEIHVGNIQQRADHLVYVQLLSARRGFWCSDRSDLLLPAGWCDSNHYELCVPPPHVEEPPRPVPPPPQAGPPGVARGSARPPAEWCERIYFNYKCYAGPFLSRSKLAQLPQHVGPGPLTLVLKEVLNKLISASYKPGKLLRDWETEGPPPPGMRLEMLKAKLKSSTYNAYVPVPSTAGPGDVALFCRGVCARLQACPLLAAPVSAAARCPESCHTQDKAKFRTHNPETVHVERRGRPKGSFKKKRGRVPEKKEPSNREGSNKDGAESAAESEHSGSTPPSDTDKDNCPKMKTRGAKLPNFALQIKEAHWVKKDVQTIYNNTYVPKKRTTPDSDIENESSRSSKSIRNISEVSDAEEPELKKLRYNHDPKPSKDKYLEKCEDIWIKGKLKLSKNPVDWTVEDVYTYLTNTEDCNLIADKLKEEEVDGEAFILMDNEDLRCLLNLRKEFALKLSRHIEFLKWCFSENYNYRQH